MYRRGRYGWDSCFGFWALDFGLGVQGFCGKGSFRGTGFWCLGSGHRASRIKGLWLRWVVRGCGVRPVWRFEVWCLRDCGVYLGVSEFGRPSA